MILPLRDLHLYFTLGVIKSSFCLVGKLPGVIVSHDGLSYEALQRPQLCQKVPEPLRTNISVLPFPSLILSQGIMALTPCDWLSTQTLQRKSWPGVQKYPVLRSRPLVSQLCWSDRSYQGRWRRLLPGFSHSTRISTKTKSVSAGRASAGLRCATWLIGLAPETLEEGQILFLKVRSHCRTHDALGWGQGLP